MGGTGCMDGMNFPTSVRLRVWVYSSLYGNFLVYITI